MTSEKTQLLGGTTLQTSGQVHHHHHLASNPMHGLAVNEGFVTSLLTFHTICLISFALLFDTSNTTNTNITDKNAVDSTHLRGSYTMYMDVHVMIFIGFEFLMTFLRKYSFSAVSLTFTTAMMALQWGIIVVTLVHQLLSNDRIRTKTMDVETLLKGNFATGAVLGRATSTQLVWMVFLEIFVYALNKFLLPKKLQVIDAGGSLVIHTSGAFFGLAVFMQLCVPSIHEQYHNASRYTPDIFAMIACLLISRDKKFDMMHLQNATLAGGVAMGASCDLALSPTISIAVGFFAGLVSTFDYGYISGFLEDRMHLADTCGVLNLHGLPGVIDGVVSGLASMGISDGYYSGEILLSIYAARHHRSALEQGGYQHLVTVVTVAITVVSGLVVGKLLNSKLFRKQQQKYEDDEWFHLPKMPHQL